MADQNLVPMNKILEQLAQLEKQLDILEEKLTTTVEEKKNQEAKKFLESIDTIATKVHLLIDEQKAAKVVTVFDPRAKTARAI